MDRRAFVAASTGCLIVAPSLADAQPAKARRIGFLTYATAEQSATLLREFSDALRRLGYVEGRDTVIETRYGDGTLNGMHDLAGAVVRSRVDIIVTGSNPIADAAKRATTTIPIVMVGTLDPVGFGIVADLARPGGNITGLCVDASEETAGKLLSLLTEALPGLSRVGVLRFAGYRDRSIEVAAQRLGIELQIEEASLDEFDGAFARLVGKRVAAVVIRGPFYVRRQHVADLAIKHRLPAIHGLREYAEAGLLMSYGPNLADLYRRAAGYVDKILRGAKPGELPIEQPTKFDLVINVRTASALGLAIPRSVLLRADELIR